ncbi:leucine zipper putative tumor suppressor 2-like [Acanthaster planci]|uniref:Leucine zipper putative tumor suppressor 2-like n=1 Tax=Acanthaster planci TaxID=133434 RepID=A0A8B7YP13_ACAPL|nr:leucine zipper putative tumor suppressor 2-like [Acanthaster planci]XP_022094402.1 leucine zipper putative tumor suppressor 2-like [Acanthaster planci]XP_022094403.1 leucine zipper putative tumor suppressor 2-like [Acanthaster planci]XP_022094404.1 leucine zipper putative tumor suppressor 2-like [Acanthaster planci]XP_022094405.1 leucine zipper putative tumor suppressor 2-like [Acanthaster planci]XP_022094406.1 leucine zipper putative tumor suppressor 2-like [Acanthaster planci]XP_02209440
METCAPGVRHSTYYNFARSGLGPVQHYKSASDGDSPDASMPMGSLASPLVDSGYREGSVTYNHEELVSGGYSWGEGPVSTGPPTITPVSGQLEKFKQHCMIRPVPLKAASPSRSLDSPCSTSSRRSLPGSPASMPDPHPSDRPHQQQPMQQQQKQQQPPDVVLTNHPQQQHSFAGNHFSGLPTKCLSLQDITPKQKNYHDNGPRGPSYGDTKAWGKQPAQPRRLQPAHSLNYLNRTAQNLQNHKLLPDYKRCHISQSSSQVDNRSRNGSSGNSGKKPVRVSHVNPSYGHVMDYNSNRVDRKSSASSSSHVSLVVEETEMDEIAALRQKVLEKEAQLTTLRDTMDNNEAAILKVHEEKHRVWNEETSWLRKELQEQEDTSRKIRHSLQAQIYKLEQEKKSLREKTDASQHPPSKEVEDLKWQLRNLKEQLSLKAQEISNLRNKLTYQEQRLSQRTKAVASLEAELERLKQERQTTEETPEACKRLLKQKEAELGEARVETNHLRDLKENLAQEVKLQEEELALLRTKVSSKDKELSQERCEVAYLREVQEKLNQQLQKKAKSGGGLLPGKGNPTSNANSLKEKLAQREKEIAQVKEQLRRVQEDKDQEVTKLRQNLKERSSEIEKLQKKLSEAEKDRSMLRNKLSSGKAGGGNKMTPLQRQLESDFMDLQVKLTTREREVFQLKRELVLLQEKSDSNAHNLKVHLKEQEQEQQVLQDRLRQRETEIGFLMDKVKSRESEIASLREELEKSEPRCRARDSEDTQRRADEWEREVAMLKSECTELHTQVSDLREESAMYKEKLDKISKGVRSLSTSQSNLINLGKTGKLPQGATATNSGPPGTTVEDSGLQEEVGSLREQLADTRKRLQGQEAAFGRERRVWQEEKEKVIKYQKQLQLNYVQMCRRNRSLESELQQLTMELEHKEISHC